MKTILKLTPKQAISLWLENKEDGTVHVLRNPNSSMFVGMDHSIESLTEQVENADEIQIGGENCMNMKHGIVVFPKDSQYQSHLLFIEHDPEKMQEFLLKYDK